MGSTVAGAAAFGLAACTPVHTEMRTLLIPREGDPEINELQERTFRWFTHVTNRANGLTPDRWPTESFSSVAAVGFALTCWPIGVERGWISREEARERTLTTIRFFHDLPQGPEATGVGGYKGFFYHFLDMQTGHRFGRTELSTVDTALLVAGMLFCARWFDGDHAEEAEIRRLAQAVYDRIEWDWVMVRPNRISMGWHPETGFIEADWHVYNEGMLVLLLAIGSATHPVPTTVWDEWCSVYDRSWTDRWSPAHLHFGPMFGHQYSHMFIDFRGIRDAWMRARAAEIGDFDYFQNSVRGVEAQQKYAIANPQGWAGYSADVWGLTACDGPGDFSQVIDGREREFFSYSARGPGERDDGTIAPTAAMASMPFAPAAVTACLKAMKARYGAAIYTEFGFLDSFNPTLTQTDQTLLHGRIVPGVGWVDGDYLGIDQGPIVIQIENNRSDVVWRRMRGEPNLTRGLKRAGFTGGWLERA
ncbi:glucoamylase family protein [Brevundimonas sp. UBA2416]|uniref:glucoamylase family protein n=1 Tax=Brevundimonas sp. UBA2416 TaxID=1946124 RepID=UPI0025C2BEA2|nr:glucoamylase family protein [Brevundimonas sp. UBA2416]HRJ62953.1 glucoamylase family protein [Brevundimonas sp.]